MNILAVVPFLLHENVKHGGGNQVLRTIKGLASAGNDIYLVCISEHEPGKYKEETESLKSFCKEIHVFQKNKLNFLKKTISFLRPSLPPHARNILSSGAEQKIKSLIDSGKIDLSYIFFAYSGAYLDFMKNSRTLLVIDTQEVGSRKYKMRFQSNISLMQRLHAIITYIREKKFEKEVFEKANLVVTITEEEKEYILSYCKPKAFHVVPPMINVENIKEYKTEIYENSLLFFGSFAHPPNHEALNWFLSCAFETIKQKQKDVCLYIAGVDSDKCFGHLNSGNIRVVGQVDDIYEWISKVQVVISPIISGGGARIKNIEALAMGKPLVTTKLGAEGLLCRDGYRVADNPEDFADRVVELLKSKKERDAVSARAAEMIRNIHNVYTVGTMLDSKLRDLQHFSDNKSVAVNKD